MPRAIDGPEMAPSRGDSTWVATRFSKITGAVVEAILRGPSWRRRARRPRRRCRPGRGQVFEPAGGAAFAAALHGPVLLGDDADAEREARARRKAPSKPSEVTSRQRGRPVAGVAAFGLGDAGDGQGERPRPRARPAPARRRCARTGRTGPGRGTGRAPAGPRGPARRRGPRGPAGPWRRRARPAAPRVASRQVGGGDGRLTPADEDAQAEVAAFLALDVLQSAVAHADGQGRAFGGDGLGGVGAGLSAAATISCRRSEAGRLSGMARYGGPEGEPQRRVPPVRALPDDGGRAIVLCRPQSSPDRQGPVSSPVRRAHEGMDDQHAAGEEQRQPGQAHADDAPRRRLCPCCRLSREQPDPGTQPAEHMDGHMPGMPSRVSTAIAAMAAGCIRPHCRRRGWPADRGVAAVAQHDLVLAARHDHPDRQSVTSSRINRPLHRAAAWAAVMSVRMDIISSPVRPDRAGSGHHRTEFARRTTPNARRRWRRRRARRPAWPRTRPSGPGSAAIIASASGAMA